MNRHGAKPMLSTPIVVLYSKDFPTGSHKVGAAYSVLVEKERPRPVAIKADAESVVHKSDLGGVALHLGEELSGRRRPDADGVAVAGCGEDRQAAPAESATVDSAAAMSALFDEYFERSLELDPISATSIGDYRFNDRLANSIGPEHRAATHALNTEFLGRLLEIDPAGLSGNDRISYELFKHERELEIEAERFPGHLQPVNQFRSMTNYFVQIGSGTGLHPFKTVKDYDDFLSRIDDFVVYGRTGANALLWYRPDAVARWLLDVIGLDNSLASPFRTVGAGAGFVAGIGQVAVQPGVERLDCIPVGATGARIMVTLIHALQQRGQSLGLATLCGGGGVSMACAVEML